MFCRRRQRLNEDFDCTTAKHHAYGANRFYLEQALADAFDVIHIVRLPGLFGPGLKKNIIFDLLNDNMLEKINPASVFQFYDLTRLWSDIERIIEQKIELIHLFPAPIQTQKIIDALFPGAAIGADQAPEAKYDYRTKYDSLVWRRGMDIFMTALRSFNGSKPSLRASRMTLPMRSLQHK